MFKPVHWEQLVPNTQPNALKSTKSLGKKYVNGEVKTEKTKSTDMVDRAGQSRLFIWQLQNALTESKKELEDLWNRKSISIEVADLITSMFNTTWKVLYKSQNHRIRGAPKTLSSARELASDMRKFRTSLDQVLTNDLPNALELACCLHEFCCDIAHYEFQISCVYGIAHINAEGHPKFTNRQTNWKAKKLFETILIAYQQTNGAGKFPKLRQIKASMRCANHSISDRTIRNWKSQIQNGTFSKFIQPKKRQ